jgi:ribonuclease HI
MAASTQPAGASGDREFITQEYFGKAIPANKVEVTLDCLTFLKCRCAAPCECAAASLDKVTAPRIIATDGGFKIEQDIGIPPTPIGTIGVFFGKDCPLNVSRILSRDATVALSSNVAEVAAIVHALEEVQCLKLTTVIVKTDCLSIVNAMVGEDDFQEFETTKITKLDAALRRTLETSVDDLETNTGARVLFWWVPREENEEADALATSAMVFKPLFHNLLNKGIDIPMLESSHRDDQAEEQRKYVQEPGDTPETARQSSHIRSTNSTVDQQSVSCC